MKIVEQLLEFNDKYDMFKNEDMSKSDLRTAIETIYNKGRYITCLDDSWKLLGYMETWRVDFEGFGKIVCHAGFNELKDNIQTGNILYLANVTVHPDYRQGWVMKYLRDECYRKNFMCEYFVGEALRKKTQPIKVLKRTALCERYLKESLEGEVVNYGRK